MSGGHSYWEVLKDWCIKLQPRRILEWGPGDSTTLMRNTCPNAAIFSFEHDKKWYEKWKVLEDNNTFIVLEEASENDRTSPKWDSYCIPMGTLPKPFGGIAGKFDLIFVDGRERVRCLEYANAVINDDGVVILHDSERPEYAKGIAMFDKVEDRDGTVVLRKKQSS